MTCLVYSGRAYNSITRVAGLTGIAGGQAVLAAGATVAVIDSTQSLDDVKRQIREAMAVRTQLALHLD